MKADDLDLIKQAQSGNKQAINMLFKQHELGLKKYLRTILRNDEDIEDVSQETMLKAYSSLRKFNGKSSVKTWLYTIGRNTAFSHLRKLKKEQLLDISLDSLDQAEQDPDYADILHQLREAITSEITPESDYFTQEMFQQIQEVVDQLEPMYQELFTLRFIDQLEYQEIADILQLPKGTIQSRMHQLNLIIKDTIKEYKDV